MHNLIEKYRNDQLSAAEMGELRQLLDSMPDSELARELGSDWDSLTSELHAAVPRDIGRRISRRIVRDISPRRRILAWTCKAVACCAAAAVCLGAGMFLQDRLSAADAAPVTVTANQEEVTEIALPDGSHIAMNPRSSISYRTVPAATGDRCIRFDGIAHFNIARNLEHPFVITNDMFDVTVRGTEFYLSAESGAMNASLYLQDGAVELLSKKTANRIDMSPGDLAVLDYATGNITVTSDTALVSVFRMSDPVRLNYVDVPLARVVASLNTCYAPFNIRMDSDKLAGLTFTGSLPRTNLMEALSVLEYTADLKISVSNSTITLYR